MPGGGPMNVAVACARLGVPSAFVGRVSTDVHGEAIWTFLRDNGVDLRACQRGPEATARAIVEHTPKLQFRFEGTGTADTMLTSVEMDRLGRGPHILHGGTLGMFRGRTAETLARLAERHPGIVSVDPNVRPQIIDDPARWHHYHNRWLARAHIYRASDEDLAWIWPGRGGAECAAELLSGNPSVVFITHGESGATVYTPDGELSADAEAVEVADEVGAGDTFAAAILASVWKLGLAGDPEGLGRMELADWRDALQLAIVAAGITCSRPGADPPRLAELPQGMGFEL
nr:carbohydrate kinase [bacterium]